MNIGVIDGSGFIGSHVVDKLIEAGKIVSTEKASKELNWQPRVDLEEGITQYIQWYKGSKLRS